MKLKIPYAASILLLYGCDVRTRLDEVVVAPGPEISLAQGLAIQGSIERVGAAHAEFIPATPTSLSGFGGGARRFIPPVFLKGGDVSFCKPFEKVELAPKIKTAVLEVRSDATSPAQNLFVVSLDLVAVTSDLTQKIHAAIDDVAGKKTANLNNTLVVATHTHSGPSGLSENPMWSAFVCDKYNPQLTNTYLSLFKETLRKSFQQLQEVSSISTRSAQIPALLKSRFDGMQPNTDISLLTFKSAHGRIPLALLRMAVHPTAYGPSDLVLTADLVAPLERATQQLFNADEVFLLQTEIGNMTANLDGQSHERWASAVANALTNSKSNSDSLTRKVSTTATRVALPPAHLNWKSCGAGPANAVVGLGILENLPQSVPLTAWKINSELNLFFPGEWTASGAELLKTALKKKMQPLETLQVYSLAHDYTGYHLNSSDYQAKALEACSSLFGQNGTEHFTDALNRLDLPQ